MAQPDPTVVCTLNVSAGCVECNVANHAAGTLVPCCNGEDVAGFDSPLGPCDYCIVCNGQCLGLDASDSLDWGPDLEPSPIYNDDLPED